MEDINFILDEDTSVTETSRFKIFKSMSLKQKLFTIFIMIPLFYLFLLPLITLVTNKIEEKRRYKKIIKKGLLWDTEYLIERD
jgi:hypothetical protein